ncbi:MAG: methyltransferase domain-containing protein, partial [Actinomycetota bacterium]
IDYVRRAAGTTRIRLALADDHHPRAGHRRRVAAKLTPNQRDFEAVDLPTWAWPAYWPLRPVRLTAGALAGKLSGPAGTVGDLGIYLGTPTGLIDPLLRFAGLAPGDGTAPQDQPPVVVDLGCGDGRVLIEAADRFGCVGRGYETDPDLVARARRAVADAGLDDRVEIVAADAAGADLSDVDLAFAFLPPAAFASILAPTLTKLPAGAALLSHEQLPTRFPIEPDRTELVLGHPDDATDGGAGAGITVANLWIAGPDR